MIFYYIFLWHFIGYVTLSIISITTSLGNVHGFPCFNPRWLYKNYRVNWFGSVMMAIGLGICCPALTVGYWFYKLCTVGRR